MKQLKLKASTRMLSLSILIAGQLFCGRAWAQATNTSAMEVHLRTRVALPDRPDGARVVCQRAQWNPSETAVIICDMWDRHWCEGASRRVAELAPVMNRVVSIAREKGVFIIHAPSDTMDHYKSYPGRKIAKDAPRAANLPDGIAKWCNWKNDAEEKAGYPIDHSDGGCDCQPKCPSSLPWTRQIDTIEIKDDDAISDSGVEIWNLLEQHGIKNAILMGVHANMCVLGRPFGLRNMVRFGKNVVLMRDLTDTMYNSRMSPFVSHFTGTDLIVEHTEKYVCPTITSTVFTGKPQFCFKNDKRPRVVFISAESEYSAAETLPEFAHELQTKYGLYCEILQGSTEKTGPDRHELTGLEALTKADLAVIFVRRRALAPEQMQYFRDYLAAGKPLIGLRTACHAFDTKGSAPAGYAEWPKFDPEVLGGNYHNHYGNGPTCTVTAAAGAQDNSILAGVKLPLTSDGSLYKVRPLADSTRQLLIGTIPDQEPEPVAWTNSYGKSRVFFTSLGHPDDFKNASFRQLLINAVFWAMNKPVPNMK